MEEPFTYEPHLHFLTPQDELKLWRYMDVGRFLALLFNKSLYLSRKHELDDPWEGVAPMKGVREALSDFPRSENNVRFIEDSVREAGDTVARRAVVSCWHANDRESVAMWNLYTSGAEGVAVQTTVGRLKKAFEQEPASITIAKVRYIDHISDELDREWALDPLSPLFCKRRGFEHEREVRCVAAHVEGEREQALVMSETDLSLRQRFPVLEQWEQVPDGDLGNSGATVGIDLAALIERIVASPRYPKWAIPALQAAVSTSGLELPVETSSLRDKPPDSTARNPVIADAK